MKLWNDYEGTTIAEAYPLGALLRSEGRSAFFTTSNGTGTPAVLRLTESIYGEHAMLETWRVVKESEQPNLVTIKSFGETTHDGVPLTYALLEKPDMQLSEILTERALTPAETTEIGKALVAALTSLHASGLVHEHIIADNVVAVGEVVKLRSDCVRVCVEDQEFTSAAECEALKKQDVRDLATLLLQCLTQQRQLSAAGRLPVPFDTLTARGINGTWGLAEMGSALNPPPAAKPIAIPSAGATTLSPRSEAVAQSVTAPVPLESVAATPAASTPEPETIARSFQPSQELPLRRVVPNVEVQDNRRTVRMAAIAGIAVLVALLIWWAMHHGSAKPTSTAEAAAQATLAAHTAAPVTAPLPARSEGRSGGGPTAGYSAGWRVVAYTYLREDQAAAKAASMQKRYSSLEPTVFAPTAHGPYLVALGGPMSERAAEALRDKARRSGLPRDTYMRNYPAR